MSYPPPLPLVRISEFDFLGVLFVNFPTDWPTEKSRRTLEHLVRRCGMVELSSVSIYTALCMERMRNFAKLPKAVRQKQAAEAWAARNERIKRLGIRPQSKKVNPSEWSFE